MTRTPRDVVVERVRDAAEKLLASHGIGAVSIRAVAAAAGVSPQTITNRFGSRSSLLDDVAYQGWKRLSAELVALGPTQHHAVVDQLRTFAASNHHLYQLMSLGPILGVAFSERTRATALGVLGAVPLAGLIDAHGAFLLETAGLWPTRPDGSSA